jgi:RNA polymerase sigma-70 factor (ECF subfamily)
LGIKGVSLHSYRYAWAERAKTCGYAGVAKQLGMNEGAARVAVHRLRKRFREIYREEISQTLAEGADLDAELRHLAAALARQ